MEEGSSLGKEEGQKNVESTVAKEQRGKARKKESERVKEKEKK